MLGSFSDSSADFYISHRELGGGGQADSMVAGNCLHLSHLTDGDRWNHDVLRIQTVVSNHLLEEVLQRTGS